MPDHPTPDSPSRRTFLKSSTVAVAGGTMLGGLAVPSSVHAASNDNTIKVGLVGIGGRGKGATVNAVHADPNVKLTAIADLFPDRLDAGYRYMKRRLKDKFAVPKEQCFSGFDAYKKLLETDVDVVILTTPPHFRPIQLKAAIEAGKHVFCEKPVAVDAPGCRSVFETVEKAKAKKLNLVSGLCWRYDAGVRATIDQIKNGAIGDIVAIQENYLAGPLWHRGHKPDWTDMEFQCRNWLYFTWLSGDHICEQHVHSLDKALWLNDNEPPVRCFGLGGRLVRTDPKFGDIYDHHAICYEFKNTKVFAYTRQMPGSYTNTEDYVLGTKGKAQILRFKIEGEKNWKFHGKRISMYQQEHNELFAAIRAGEVINNGTYMTRSTMMAVMGRMAEYTGQSLTWDQALNSKLDLTPKAYKFGPAPEVKVAMPGTTKFI